MAKCDPSIRDQISQPYSSFVRASDKGLLHKSYGTVSTTCSV